MNTNTAEEIVERLKQKNYIPSSARPEYEAVLLTEYRKYVEGRTCCSAK